MSYKWDDKLIKKFLILYRKHKCLWNPYSTNYTNCDKKNEAFEIVLKELNLPEIKISHCIKQIEIIREKYKQEQLKIERELKCGKLYVSKIPWFDLMSQMLCEVINDEENFSESSSYLKKKFHKLEKYCGNEFVENNYTKNNIRTKEVKQLEDVDSGFKEPIDTLKTVNESINSSWNNCPNSCGWETNNNKEEFDNYNNTKVKIIPEFELPLGIKRTEIINTYNQNNTTMTNGFRDKRNDKNFDRKIRKSKETADSNMKNIKTMETNREDDKKIYEVRSKFKIVIPCNSDYNLDNNNLEITGYKVRALSPEISKIILYNPSLEKQKTTKECLCENENPIELQVNKKSVETNRNKKESFENIQLFSNKETQTDINYESRNSIEISKLNFLKSTRDQACGTDDLISNTTRRSQYETTLRDETLMSENRQIENPQLQSEIGNFNNTRMIVNVIVRILESDENSNEISENLQTTLDTMLDRFQQNITEYSNNFASRNATFDDSSTRHNDTSISTQYENLPIRENRQARNPNLQKTANKTIELNNTSENIRSELLEVTDNTTRNSNPQTSVLIGEMNVLNNNNNKTDHTNRENNNNNKRNSLSLNEINKSIKDTNKSIRNERPASLITTNLNHSNFENHSFLNNYTNEFSNDEPVASSSRRIREHRSPSELLKEFLDVIKLTLTMDAIQQSTEENGNKDCCKKN